MPRIPDKPQFPQLSAENLKKTLDKVNRAVEEATNADGEVSLDDVAARLAGDDAALAALDEIRSEDAFERTETRTSVSCGGSTSTYEARVAPETLQGAEVRSVLGALIAAKGKVDQLDADGDGVISKPEAEQDAGDDLAANLADATVGLPAAAFEREMDAWAYAIRDARSDIESRTRAEGRIESAARRHAATDAGADAIAWSFREMIAKGLWVGDDLLESELKGAETSWLRYLPLFDAAGPGHLSDVEVERFLGADDLRGFADAKKAELEDKVGMSWDDFLAGRDIEGVDQIDDPDVDARTSRGSYGC